MKLNLSLIVLLGSILTACSAGDVSADNVPNVDPQNIIVNGAPMTAKEFHNKYCQGMGKLDPYKSCDRVLNELERQFLKNR